MTHTIICLTIVAVTLVHRLYDHLKTSHCCILPNFIPTANAR